MKQIRLSKGLFALVSDEDFEFLLQWKWCASYGSRGTKWYAVRKEGRRTVRMHREVLCRKYNSLAPLVPQLFNMVVDHINHNSLDNRRENLELVTQTENMRRSEGWKKKK